MNFEKESGVCDCVPVYDWCCDQCACDCDKRNGWCNDFEPVSYGK